MPDWIAWPGQAWLIVPGRAVPDGADMPLTPPEATIGVAQTYVADCLAELGQNDLLGVGNTEPAIRDLELFRLAIGVPQVWVYGESYGTPFAQQYATAIHDVTRRWWIFRGAMER